MNTLMNDTIYVSMSRWDDPPENDQEESKEKRPNEADYSSSDDDAPEIKPSRPADLPKAKPSRAPATVAFDPKPKQFEKPKRRHIRKTNPNAICINYSELLKMPANNFVGKPLICGQCSALYDSLNCNVNKNTWMCKFCGVKKVINEPLPILSNSCGKYCLGDAEKVKLEDEEAEYVIIIDTSGSMSLIGAYNAKNPKESKTVLTILTESISKKLNDMAKDTPNAKVGIILINMEVQILGDCSGSSPEVISDERILCDEKALREKAATLAPGFFKQPISASASRITEKLIGLEENGATALGPAIVCALEILKGRENGRILVYTDGLSNIGVGDLTEEDPRKLSKNKQCYINWGAISREQGTQINFFSIDTSEKREGDDSFKNFDTTLYYPLVSASGGSIYAVKPSDILDDIMIPEGQDVLAKKVVTKLSLPGVIKFCGILDRYSFQTSHTFEKKYGQILSNSKELLQFKVNPGGLDREEAEKLDSIPINLTVRWVDEDSKIYLFSLTKEFKVIRKKSKHVNLEVLKDLMNRLTKENVINNQNSIAEFELKDMIEKYLEGSEIKEDEVVKGMRKEAEQLKINLSNSKKSTGARTIMFTQEFGAKKPEQKKIQQKKGPATVQF